MSKTTKQVALLVALRLRGLATVVEATEEYIVVRAHSLATVRPAQAAAQQIEDELGWLVVVRG
jgi:hypothetical protein